MLRRNIGSHSRLHRGWCRLLAARASNGTAASALSRAYTRAALSGRLLAQRRARATLPELIGVTAPSACDGNGLRVPLPDTSPGTSSPLSRELWTNTRGTHRLRHLSLSTAAGRHLASSRLSVATDCAAAPAPACGPRHCGMAGAPPAPSRHPSSEARDGGAAADWAPARGWPPAALPWAAASTPPLHHQRTGASGAGSSAAASARTFRGRPGLRLRWGQSPRGPAGARPGSGRPAPSWVGRVAALPVLPWCPLLQRWPRPGISAAGSGSAGTRLPCVGRSTMVPSTSSAWRWSPVLRSSRSRRPAGRVSQPS